MKSFVLSFFLAVAAAVGLVLAQEPAAENNHSSGIHPDCLISRDGIGPFKPGMTIAQFRKAAESLPLGKVRFEEIENFMVDFSAVALLAQGETLVYAVVSDGEQSNPESEIELVMTTSPMFRLANGVGPGMLLEQVATITGPIGAGLHLENESREYLKFEENSGIPRNVSIRGGVPSINGWHAGIYSESGQSTAPYIVASGFKPWAYIKLIEVSRIYE